MQTTNLKGKSIYAAISASPLEPIRSWCQFQCATSSGTTSTLRLVAARRVALAVSSRPSLVRTIRVPQRSGRRGCSLHPGGDCVAHDDPANGERGPRAVVLGLAVSVAGHNEASVRGAESSGGALRTCRRG